MGVARVARIVVVASLCAPAGARAADPPVFGAPVVVAPGHVVGTGVGLDGTAAVLSADASTQPGRTRLLVSRRPAAVNAWSTPETIADEPATSLTDAFARDPLGDEAALWVDPAAPPSDPVLDLRVHRAADADFGPAQDVTLPPRPPLDPRQANAVDGRGFDDLQVAVAADGAVAIAACEYDSHTPDGSRMLLWLQPPGQPGTWRDMGACLQTVRLGSDARGAIDVLWSGPPDGAGEAAPRVIWVARRAPGATAFGAKLGLSDPARDADDNSAAPDLLVASTGAAVALWDGSALPPSAGPAPIASEVHVARSDANGDWQPSEQPSSGLAFRPTVAVNALGATAVVWNGGRGIAGALAAPGRPFAPSFEFPAREGPSGEVTVPVALDAFGDVVVVVADGAVARRADGTVSAPAAFVPEGTYASDTHIATDPFGSGLLVTTLTVKASGHAAVVALPYGAAPPAVSDLRLTPGALTMQLAQPARVGVDVVAGARAAKDSALLTPRPGRERVVLSGRARALLRARSARIVVRARNAGPQVQTIRRTARQLRR